MMHFRDLKIKSKILSGAFTLVLITVIFGVLAYVYIGKVSDALFNITDKDAKAVEYATEVERDSLETRLAVRLYLADKKDEQIKKVHDQLKEVMDDLDKVDAIGNKYGIAQLLEQSRVARKATQDYGAQFDKAAKAIIANKLAVEEMSKNGDVVGNAAQKFLEMQVDAYTKAKKGGADANTLDQFVQRYIITTHIYEAALKIMRAEKEEVNYSDRKSYKFMKETLPALMQLYDKLEKITNDPTELNLIKEARQATIVYEKAADGWIKTDDGLKAILNEAQVLGENVIKQALAAEEAGYKELEKAKESAQGLISQSNTIIITTILVAIVFGALIAIGLASVISRPVVKGVAFASAIAAGDFTRTLDIDQKDEIGVLADSLRQMVATLKSKIEEAAAKSQAAEEEAAKARQAMAEADEAKGKAERAKAEGMLQAAGQLEGVVEVATSASTELSAQIEQSNRGSEEQSSRVRETAAAMEEMNATVLEVARNASEAAHTADGARSKAQEGEQIVQQVVKEIGEVRKQATELKHDMGTLGKQAEDIGQIMNVISDIADQTNLLALNAAIEAARAGDAGRGFAVVADEVRKLAEKTMDATKEVGDAIRGIQNGTKKNMDNVDRAAKSVEEATNLASRSGDALKQIVQFIAQASDQVRSIATASEQQSATSEEINKAIEQVATISSETAQGMTQAAQAVNELANQIQILQNLITEMKSEGATA
jgi:methyl-accepting chemotaxis protein